MAEYIEREAAIDALQNHYEVRNAVQNGIMDECVMLMMRVPAADVIPVRHGRWVDDKGNPVPWDEWNKNCPRKSAFCSVCGKWLTASDEYPVIGNFCPNCGAKMDSKDGDGE